MKKIDIKKGLFAIVDDDDFEKVRRINWRVHFRKKTKCMYVLAHEPGSGHVGKIIYLHRMIMGNPMGAVVDHINHDTLDNRKINLRVCTQKQNAANHSGWKNKKGKYKGVYRNRDFESFTVRIGHKYIGCFRNERAAAVAFNEAAKERYGEFAFLNKID